MPRNSRSTLLGKRVQREQEQRIESLIRLRQRLRRRWKLQVMPGDYGAPRSAGPEPRPTR